MPKEILMPALAAGMEEGHLVRWLKSEGEAVKRGDLLAEIETDKAVMEMEAEDEGRLGPILIADGSRGVAVGTLIASILADGETAPARAASLAVAPAVAAPVVAAVPAGAASSKPAPSTPAPSTPAPLVPAAPVPSLAARAPSIAALVAARKVVASPLARRLADDLGVDLAALSGSGPKGRIVRIDVEKARHQRAAPAAPRLSTAAPRLSPGAGQGGLNHAWLRQGEGRPLVLVHGFGSELNGWRPFLAGAALSRPVLGIDLPGHGGSAGHGAARFEALVAAVGETLERLGLFDLDLVAHSLGAAVAVALAAEGYPDVRSLFLLAPAGLGPDINGAFVSGLARARTAESLAPWMGELVADPAVLTPAFVRAAAAARADEALVAAQLRLAAALFPDGTQAFSVRAELEQLRIPVTVVAGTEDRIIPPGHMRRLPGMVGLHLFSGVGHMPQLEIRDAVWRLLERHLRAAG
ncbi:acetoin dehydrogenase dihydrolipoyllysine-residue acetyltransferase subunit [Xanthobacter autotrophicus]|uniref:acetoin dehydrogenase dihydrolipoyllysine-residue acetyltransferase subunit n=1 Tax=Xanthobacter autotrophicus TaxID=280 RepID=UPI0024A689FE|nr:acetoin dehydrogenase dihydrolipoyllysine-residue acetyltransferase subunit [Xanthobacter autotrophicus]MDI4657032.1 acetoin dehydrogenase dihydrolipoyllysine-residue acetyltransferase subunit [Xanthobacter autotrophicus]